jgi:hypothetical protein
MAFVYIIAIVHTFAQMLNLTVPSFGKQVPVNTL